MRIKQSTMANIKINILSPGRFHVCDLARELNKNGFDVKFYSFVPIWRAQKFGLPKKCSASVIGFMFPFLFMERILFVNKLWAKKLRIMLQDVITGLYMRKCDVLIAMSGDFLYAVRRAKKDGALIILERGSKHILEQRKILENIPSLKGKKPVPDINVKRELEGYQLADYIAIATLHVKRSFEQYDFPVKKLFVNPYGVDLSMFKPLPTIKKVYDIIMVGGWSYQKGCDLIIEAIRKTNYTFLHVGAIVDLPFPTGDRYTHVDPVDQRNLVYYYNKAKIFVLPSRQEGLAMVQAQAIACNLPLLGSIDSGAEDLKAMVDNPECITLLAEYTVDALVAGINETVNKFQKLHGQIYGGHAINNLTWEAYGKRYADFLHKIVN